MKLDSESPLAAQLKDALTGRLIALNISDDADYVAEFIVVLISNDKTVEEITQELGSLFDNSIPQSLIQEAFDQLARAQESGSWVDVSAPPQAQFLAPPQAQFLAPSQAQFLAPPQAQFLAPPQAQFLAPYQGSPEQYQSLTPAGPSFQSTLPTGPRNLKKLPSKGITKTNTAAARTNRVSGMAAALSHTSAAHSISKRPLGRCPDFPHCKTQQCPLAHPTRPCFAYPNCSNPPGTCNFLHTGEDDLLMIELERNKAEFQAKKRAQLEQKQLEFQQHKKSLMLLAPCKFALVCQKEGCPFGHPTPANGQAKITQLEWCPAGRGCTDATCSRAHPSPGYKPTAEEVQSRLERSLEQCRFGAGCTNYSCTRRHATSPVMCREGAKCKRADCYFTHPVEEQCRFGVNCKNKVCAYQHPMERAALIDKPMVWSRTSERQFAVAEDEVMESAPPQEA